jgi:tetratricopeptide (TPR) repeat protein
MKLKPFTNDPSTFALTGVIGTIVVVIAIAVSSISFLSEFPMTNLVLGLVTVTGSIAALVYFLDIYFSPPPPTATRLLEQRYFQSLELNRALERKDGMARDYADLGRFYKQQGNLRKAKEMYQQSVELYQELGDSHADVVQQWLTELQTHSPLYKEV